MKRPEPKNLSTKACRLLRPTALAGTLALTMLGIVLVRSMLH